LESSFLKEKSFFKFRLEFTRSANEKVSLFLNEMVHSSSLLPGFSENFRIAICETSATEEIAYHAPATIMTLSLSIPIVNGTVAISRPADSDIAVSRTHPTSFLWIEPVSATPSGILVLRTRSAPGVINWSTQLSAPPSPRRLNRSVDSEPPLLPGVSNPDYTEELMSLDYSHHRLSFLLKVSESFTPSGNFLPDLTVLESTLRIVYRLCRRIEGHVVSEPHLTWYRTFLNAIDARLLANDRSPSGTEISIRRFRDLATYVVSLHQDHELIAFKDIDTHLCHYGPCLMNRLVDLRSSNPPHPEISLKEYLLDYMHCTIFQVYIKTPRPQTLYRFFLDCGDLSNPGDLLHALRSAEMDDSLLQGPDFVPDSDSLNDSESPPPNPRDYSLTA